MNVHICIGMYGMRKKNLYKPLYCDGFKKHNGLSIFSPVCKHSKIEFYHMCNGASKRCKTIVHIAGGTFKAPS